MSVKSWKYRLYPYKAQQKVLDQYLHECKNLWNSLLEYTKTCYEETANFPTRKELYLKAKEMPLFSQVAQNVADRLSKSLGGMLARKRAGRNAGFPRFKSIDRVKSFTYPQFGFRLSECLELSGIGSIAIKKHREMVGRIKTLTIKKTPSGKWFAVFTSEIEKTIIPKNPRPIAGVDLGIEHFAYLSDGAVIENPRHLKRAEKKLKRRQRQLSGKLKGSKNRRKARLRVAVTYEKLTNRRRDNLHKISRLLIDRYSFIAMENLNVLDMSRGFLAKSVLDCSWAEFSDMLRYKAEEAGCEVVFVDPAHTTSGCSNCGLVQKKSLAVRWHSCPCGASMPRDLNAAINILNRATSGTEGCQACGEEASIRYKHNGQVSSVKQEAHDFSRG